MARFENRTSTVKGFVVNVTEQSMQEFEIKTSYVRSNEKAAKMAAEILKVEAPNVVAISEIINETPKRAKYDNALVASFAYAIFDDEESAKNCKVDYTDYSIVTITNYEYNAKIWLYYAQDDLYETADVYVETYDKLTKGRARQALLNKAVSDYETLADVLQIHNAHLDCEVEQFALIHNDSLKDCEI